MAGDGTFSSLFSLKLNFEPKFMVFQKKTIFAKNDQHKKFY